MTLVEDDFQIKEKKPKKIQLKSITDNEVLDTTTSWKDLGLHETLIETLEELKYFHPTKIQKEVIPYAVKGNLLIFIFILTF